MLKCKVLATSYPVDILDDKKEKIGEANSIHEAAKFCKLRSGCSIWNYLFIKRTRKDSAIFTGVRSPMTGKRFHFKLRKYE